MLYKLSIPILILNFISLGSIGQKKSIVWSPDNGNNTYSNPIIHTDYSDPDICQVGEDFYLTSSSFNAVPGLPILHSKDLVNWEIINHAIPEFPGSYFDIPQHGNGVWAPCLRYHQGTYYIYWGDPDRGIYMVKTQDPTDKWSAPVLVKKAYGNIDPSPLWDEDGKVYLVHAFAHSRAGIKSTLQVVELSPEGDEILDKGIIVFDGHKDHPTIEGPKFYKRNGYYYIFAPAGGVPTGWQLVLRSKNVYGPYEERIVLAQGSTDVNGPHQGGLVELENGESWFVHFQDKEAYGRIVHLEPVRWIDDWPVMGNDSDGDGTGEPVQTHAKPKLPKSMIFNPLESDEFEKGPLGLQWQWNANPQPGWYSTDYSKGNLTLYSVPNPERSVNLWMQPNLLLQKFPAPSFTNTLKLDASRLKPAETGGLVIFGLNYATLSVTRTSEGFEIQQTQCINADKNFPEQTNEKAKLNGPVFYLRSVILEGGKTQFMFSQDGKNYTKIGKEFTAREGKWVGAKSGVFCVRKKETGLSGHLLIDWFRVEPVD